MYRVLYGLLIGICISGLQLTFNLDQDDYSADLAHTAGVRVVVHPQERMPFPEDEGISAPPGQMTYIGIRLVRGRLLTFMSNLKLTMLI